MTDTDLKITGRAIPAGSMRGLRGDIAPVANGVVIEMLDGSMRDQTVHEARKFEGSLTTEDVNAPPVFGWWIGTRMEIDFPVLFVQPVGEDLIRPAVPGTVFYTDAGDNIEVPAPDAANRGDSPPATFVNYRPRLSIILPEPWKASFDEWGATVGLNLKWREA